MGTEYKAEVQELFSLIREAFVHKKNITTSQTFALEKVFDSNVSIIYITLFQEGLKPLRFGSKQSDLFSTLNRVINRLNQNIRINAFDIANASKCRLLFEMVTHEYPCNIRNLTTMRMRSPNRFEPGVNGLKYKYEGKTRFFMPTDGYTKSIMSVNQLLNYLSKQCGVAKRTNKISERVHLMRREPIEYTFIESLAYVSFEQGTLYLHRGYPYPLEFSKELVYEKMMKSLDWLVDNMNEDGSFLYYYDPFNDTIVDDMHPNMINPLYNNILRHSGGTISLLRGYELSGQEKYLHKAKASLDFLISTFRTHLYENEEAYYPFFNKKSKLGGAGIGLVALMHYYMHTGNEEYRKYIDGLVRHILSRVDEEGELIGYYIHPKFNDGKPLIGPNDEVKKELFSFYYPGEALLGLALYYHHMKNVDGSFKNDILQKSEKALDFLVNIRPKKYDYMFESLPADAWLMQAIEEWVKVKSLKKQSYIDFVFNDTKQMFDHMYKYDNVYESNKDYVGGFYYNYGDHVYHDASRCEGVVSAYYLAKYLGDEEKASWIMKHMKLSAKGLMQTFHDEKSSYAHKHPEKAMHSFRFKLTRQWVRVDSVQHASCFFARLLPVFDDNVVEYKEPTKEKKDIKKEPEEMLSPFMILDSVQLANITQGKWFNQKENLIFNGIRVNIKRVKEGNLCFTSNPTQWGENIPMTEDKLNTIFQNGAKAVVVTSEEIAKQSKKPVLLVENSKKALKQIAMYIRDKYEIPRVLVTGTEGKTGFKNQLYTLLSYQTNVHASLDSSNLDVPILCSLASLKRQDKVEVIEASVADPNRGITRSNLVKPNICVITELGIAHIKTHGSFEKMIKHKAGIVNGLRENGICILNRDNKNYDLVREEIYKIKYVDIRTFGSHPHCNARLLNQRFDEDELKWYIQASIEGIEINYSVPLIGQHVPLSSLAPLLTLYYLGYNVKKAAKDFNTFKSVETMGCLSRISSKSKSFLFFDHSHRASVLNYISALKDLKVLHPEKKSKKIAVIGNMLNIGNESKKAHEDLTSLIEAAKVDRLYTIGKFAKPIHNKLKNKSILVAHADNYEEIKNDILNDIEDGDLIFVKGHHRIWLKHFADDIYALGERCEIR